MGGEGFTPEQIAEAEKDFERRLGINLAGGPASKAGICRLGCRWCCQGACCCRLGRQAGRRSWEISSAQFHAQTNVSFLFPLQS